MCVVEFWLITLLSGDVKKCLCEVITHSVFFFIRKLFYNWTVGDFFL